jgi:hypothetical protein
MSKCLATCEPPNLFDRQSQGISGISCKLLVLFQAVHNYGLSNLLYVIEHTKALSNTFPPMTLLVTKVLLPLWAKVMSTYRDS